MKVCNIAYQNVYRNNVVSNQQKPIYNQFQIKSNTPNFTGSDNDGCLPAGCGMVLAIAALPFVAGFVEPVIEHQLAPKRIEWLHEDVPYLKTLCDDEKDMVTTPYISEGVFYSKLYDMTQGFDGFTKKEEPYGHKDVVPPFVRKLREKQKELCDNLSPEDKKQLLEIGNYIGQQAGDSIKREGIKNNIEISEELKNVLGMDEKGENRLNDSTMSEKELKLKSLAVLDTVLSLGDEGHILLTGGESDSAYYDALRVASYRYNEAATSNIYDNPGARKVLGIVKSTRDKIANDLTPEEKTEYDEIYKKHFDTVIKNKEDDINANSIFSFGAFFFACLAEVGILWSFVQGTVDANQLNESYRRDYSDDYDYYD